ncbi:flagellar protein FliS [Gemmata sp. JC717]|uniref:Flagellar protein FliS n=1 Tax=Gemmata algarum TaxID=2975278 RepID=A0ABU5EW83_9BACT|nr:flagellar protein FliS [Gemmata algarum]MDY3556831.1 flagellar protein FliS [Gemmata algarum]MDY3557879.1 flagellar protein FliS [Gemmata algarum]
MNLYRRYQQSESDAGWTRMDLLIALYDKALERLDRAEAALGAANPSEAMTLLLKVQQIIMALADGVRVEVNPEANTNMLRLYEHAMHEVAQATAPGIANARKVLQTLRQGFEAVREEANALERSGRLSPMARAEAVIATA